MDMHAALLARIRADAGVAAIVGGRVDWGGLTAIPAFTLRTVSGVIAQTMKGVQSMQSVRVQVDCWAKTHDQANALANAVLAACLPRTTVQGIYFRSASATHPRDLGEQTSAGYIHRKQTDLTVRYSAA